MAVIGQILLWLLWIVLGILALALTVLLAALLIPVRVRFCYDTAGFSAVLQILFFKKKLLPAEKTPKTKAKTEAGADAPSEQEIKRNGSQNGHKNPKPRSEIGNAEEKKPAASDSLAKRILESLPELLGMAGRFIGAVLRSLRFGGLTVIVPVSGGEPDAVARKVGRTNAWFYAIASPLENSLHLRWKQVHIFPDYEGDRSGEMQLSGWVRGQLLPVVIAAMHLLRGLKKENIL